MAKTALDSSKKSSRLKDLFHLPKSLLVVFLTTLLMRAGFYLSIAILTNPNYLPSMTELQRDMIFIAYPLAELLTVSFFGILADKIGRKIVYFIGLGVTGLSILLFAFVSNFAFLIVISCILGIGAGAKVASTLAIVADEAPEDKRGRYMGFYDAMTLLGLGVGFGGGFLLLEIRFDDFIPESSTVLRRLLYHDPKVWFLTAAIILIISLILAVILLRKKVFQSSLIRDESFLTKFKVIIKEKSIRYLLPVWVPIICLYAIILRSAETLASQLELHDISLLVVLIIIFASILIGFPLNGLLSDRIGRKPFLYVGMFSFAAFVTLLISFANNSRMLLYLSPLLLIIGIGCGAFPPAALALLADLTEKERYGSTMGVYSVVYGTGMVIGPLLSRLAGGATSERLWGILILIWLLCTTSVVGTFVFPKDMIKQKI